jgi:hypothetical protein
MYIFVVMIFSYPYHITSSSCGNWQTFRKKTWFSYVYVIGLSAEKRGNSWERVPKECLKAQQFLRKSAQRCGNSWKGIPNQLGFELLHHAESANTVSATFANLPQLYNLPAKNMPSQKKSSWPNEDTRTPQQKAADTRKANKMRAQELQECDE